MFAVGGGTGDELCLNGDDDDEDVLVDCADPDCSAGFTCVVSAPLEWSGPVVLFHAPAPALRCLRRPGLTPSERGCPRPSGQPSLSRLSSF